MQAILCKYLNPADARGAKIKATCAAGSVTIGYPHELSGQACFRAAAEALSDKLGWSTGAYGQLLGGQLKTGEYVFVFNNSASKE